RAREWWAVCGPDTRWSRAADRKLRLPRPVVAGWDADSFSSFQFPGPRARSEGNLHGRDGRTPSAQGVVDVPGPVRIVQHSVASRLEAHIGMGLASRVWPDLLDSTARWGRTGAIAGGAACPPTLVRSFTPVCRCRRRSPLLPVVALGQCPVL